LQNREASRFGCATRTQELQMQACAPRTVSTLAVIACVAIPVLALVSLGVSIASAAPAQSTKGTAAKPNGAKGAAPRGPRSAAAKPHGPRSNASQEAARLGTAVGHDCNGRAAMQRGERQWVVLCSNGKTYVVEAPAVPGPGAPATQCSLAGSGPEPPCFGR
jgi:hypothetical protein